ncbi:MAG: RNA polymerase sigma factor [Bacteroidia bacterium]
MEIFLCMTAYSRDHLSIEQINAEQTEVLAAQRNPLHFEPLYNRYYKRILSFVYQRIDDKEAAYDITGAVFYRALNKLDGYENKGLPFSAWLYRIALNELNAAYRLQKTRRTINLDDIGEQALRDEIPELSEKMQDDELRKAFQILEVAELELIDQRFFEGRSFRELSEITGMEESAVKMKVYRILERLRKELIRIRQ